jgi:predicted Zn-dependent protease
MIESHEMQAGATLAEAQGMTEELGRAIAGVAGAELEAGRLPAARELLHGLVVTNPHDPAPWALLALVERRSGRPLAARLCAEVAARLAPDDPQVRLVHAEVLLCTPEDRPRARTELAALGGGEGRVAARARSLLAALG